MRDVVEVDLGASDRGCVDTFKEASGGSLKVVLQVDEAGAMEDVQRRCELQASEAFDRQLSESKA